MCKEEMIIRKIVDIKEVDKNIRKGVGQECVLSSAKAIINRRNKSRNLWA